MRYAQLKRVALSLLLFLFTVSFSLAQSSKKVSPKNNGAHRHLTYTIINGEQNTFGYDILEGRHILVHQPTMPAMPGNKGFATKEDAEKVAKLVIRKINQNMMPPSVTPQELKNLKIKI